MKNKILMLMIVGLVGFCVGVYAQNVGISASPTFTPDASAILDISSTTKGLLIPRSSSNPSTTTNGLMFYNTTSNLINVNTASNLSAATFIPLLSNITVTAPLTYTTGTGTLTLPVAATGASGYLASGDWTTFNNKQPLINNPSASIGFVKANGQTITFDPTVYVSAISGSINFLPKFGTNATTMSNSLIYDNSTTTSTVGIATGGAATSTLQVNGSFSTSVGSYTATSVTSNWPTASLVLITTSTLVTLPTAVGISGRIYTIKNISAATFNVVPFVSTQTIDGATGVTLSATNKFITIQSDGGNWYILGNN